MLIDIKIPPLSESVATATLLAWEKQIGEAVRRNEVLLSIETDKIVLDIPAPVAGVLAEILRHTGDEVPAGEIIARIDTEAAATITRVSPPPVVAAPAPVAAEPPVETPAPVSERPQRRVALSPLRQKVAQRLLQSQQQTATLTTFNEVNMGPVMELRREHRADFEKQHGVKLGFMSFFVKAVVSALRAYPILNAALEGNEIVYHDFYDIGIAVGSARGLVVPVLRDADQLSLVDIEKKIADFSARAGSGRLGIEELSGGTFSISNGGVFGSMLSTPVLNPPQGAILGIHATKDRPVVENGEIVIRPINYLALSYDHRLIDGREAVLGLVAIKSALENPLSLFAD